MKHQACYQHLDIDVEFWLEAIRNFTRKYGDFSGSEQTLITCASSA